MSTEAGILNALFEKSSEGIMVIDLQHSKPVYMNESIKHQISQLAINGTSDQEQLEAIIKKCEESIALCELREPCASKIIIHRETSYGLEFEYSVINLNDDSYLLVQCKDISERLKVESELALKDQLLSAVANALNSFLQGTDLEQSIITGMATIGESIGVSRIYYFENRYDTDQEIWFTSHKYEWNSGDADPQIENPYLQSIPFEEYGEFFTPLLQMKPLVGLVKNFEPNLKAALESQDIKSILVYPIYIEGVFEGFIGFDECKMEREWSDSEKDILYSFCTGMSHAIRQRKQSLELMEAKSKAEHAAHAKEIFLANMSHEVRTPMNAIIGMTDLLYKSQLNTKQESYLKAIQSSAENLLRIINDILDFSKIEAGKLSLNYTGFSLEHVVKNIMDTQGYLSNEKSVSLDFNIDPRIHDFLLGDATRISQVLINLVSNALKFTEEGSVTLSCRLLSEIDDTQKIEFNVVDTGIGISNEKIHEIFESFYQENEQISKRYGGTGLGLSICKKLVHLMGGEIRASSVKHIGSVFTFTLTLKKTLQTEKQPEIETIDYTEALGKLNILVAEDNKLNQYLITSMLDKYCPHVTIVPNGALAVDALKNEKYDIVLMDVQMPEMDGLTATNLIRTELKLPVAIIGVTANALKGDDSKCFEAGMNDYLSKPFKEKDLLKKIIINTKGLNSAIKTITHKVENEKSNSIMYDLEELRALQPDQPEFVREMLSIFIEQLRNLLRAIPNWDLNEPHILNLIESEMHQLKSPSGLLRIDELYQIAVEIENLAKKNRSDIISKMVSGFTILAMEVIENLETEPEMIG